MDYVRNKGGLGFGFNGVLSLFDECKDIRIVRIFEIVNIKRLMIGKPRAIDCHVATLKGISE